MKEDELELLLDDFTPLTTSIENGEIKEKGENG